VEALDLIEREPFDVIVSDLRMPGLDGLEFLFAARQHRPNGRRLLVSGFADLSARLDAINRVGVDRLLTKPWNVAELKGAVHAAAEYGRMAVDNARMTEMLREKASQLASINRRLDSLVEERTDDLLNGLVSALDLRDTETQWHSRRVGRYARRLATELGISGRELDDVERGAMLHDIGKIGVRDAVLLKPGPLTEEEWVEMRRHPDYGYKLLEGIRFLDSARLIVLHHQERFDGSGYPSMLRGNEIALGARIFAVVDTLDAMTSDRPYRKAVDFGVSKQEIIRCAGTQLDPRVVEAFCSIPETEFRAIRDMLPDNPQEGDDGIRWGASIAASRLLRDLGGR
jgi:response regulator RpfG family c-di-GMP phosphodiesterase